MKTLEQKMVLAQKGDKGVYEDLLKHISVILRGYLSKNVSSKADIEDITQEILISIHRARATYDGKRPLKPWIFAIAHYRLNDYLRQHYRKASREVVDYDAMENALADNVTEKPHGNELEGMLDTLSEKQKKIVYMMKVDGYTAKEVAKEMGMNVSAVKVAAHRAYKQLKNKIGAA